MFSKDKMLVIISGALTVLMVGLAIVGGFRSYSPVPFWDEWGGALNFFTQVNEGDNAAWWAQHNEHRIVLARLLFWANSKWFNGASWPLITFNYFLVCANVLIFWRIQRDITATEKPTIAKILLGLFIAAWLFLWIQHENLTWGFQSQFFLAQLLPLCGLYWLHKSVVEIHASRHFLVACGFGLASVGTMANGVLALPLMTLYALITRQSLMRVSALASLSMSTFFFYFHDYHAPDGHGSLFKALKENPVDLIQYILLYIGSPFYYLFGEGGFGKVIAFVAGLVLVGSSAWFTISSLRKPREITLQFTMLFFIFYIGGTAFGTAGGRLIFGVDQALSSRYTTPALMMWGALLLIYSPTILAVVRMRGIKVLIPFGALAFLMIPLQFKALESQDGILFERKIAALALELGVKDQKQIIHVFPSTELALSLAEKASIHNLSIFGVYPFRDAKEQLGMPIQQLILPACQGYLDTIEPTDGDARFVRVNGWIFNSADKSIPQVINFLDKQHKVVGYALTGQIRQDVAKVVDQKALLAGYQGYLFADQMGAMITLQGEKPSCQIQVKVPVLPYSLTSIKPSLDQVTLSSINILPGNQWLGADSWKSVINDMKIYGSYINSDADVGSISLRIKRGDRVFYRSGPTGGHQILEVSGNALPPVKLAVSTEWALLDFSSMILPDGDFIIKFSDNGADWGEWSAIAVKQSSH